MTDTGSVSIGRVLNARKLQQAGHVARKTQTRSAEGTLEEKPLQKVVIYKSRRQKNSINIYNNKLDHEDIIQIQLVQDRIHWKALSLTA